MNKLAAALISACLMCAGSVVYAQDAMSKDAMSTQNAMSRTRCLRMR